MSINNGKNNKSNFADIIGIFVLLLILGGGYLYLHHPTAPQKATVSQNNNQQVNQLANLQYHAGQSAIVTVNNNQPTVKLSDWQKNQIEYQPLDNLNRTSGLVVANLNQKNVTDDTLRTEQTVKPTGWHQKFNANHQPILNRGHIIAYSLSKGINMDGQYTNNDLAGDQNNPKNLFTQTAFCNQKLQTIYETKVRKSLEHGAKVVYAVQPIFKGNELMARGVHLQAIGSDEMHFNVYLFNVQPHYKINYLTGESIVDDSLNVPTPSNAPKFN